MASITEIADKFFVACETGKGWEACKAYCTPGATFAAQAEPLADVKSLPLCPRARNSWFPKAAAVRSLSVLPASLLVHVSPSGDVTTLP